MSQALKHGERLPFDHCSLVGLAHEAGVEVFNLLRDHAASKLEHDGFGRLTFMDVNIRGVIVSIRVQTKLIKDGPGSSQYVPYVTCKQYIMLARALVGNGTIFNDSLQRLKGWLETAINARKYVHAWYCRLPTSDTRVRYNDNHKAFIKTLQEMDGIIHEL